jgi:putative ABC transport system substrate-binding protein
MNRRDAVVALLAFATPSVALPQQSGSLYRVGLIIPPSEEGSRPWVNAFREGLRAFGYVEGKNLVLDARFGEDDLGRLPALAVDVVRQNPDVILTASAPGVRAVRNAAGKIPIVIAAVYDPVGQGFVASLARPGGNITGLSVQYEDTIPKLLELTMAVAPMTKKIVVLRTVDQSHDSFLIRIASLTRPMQIQILSVEVRTPLELESALAKIGETRDEALMVLPHPLFNTRADAVVRFAAAKGMTAIYPFRNYAEAGGLMSFGVDISESFRRAAYFVDRILKGAKPADLPVEQPTKIDLIVNLRTAKTLGIKIPQSVLLRADQVIE